MSQRLCQSLSLLLLIGLAACTTPYKSGRILPPGQTFPGLTSIVSAEPIDVISIHGMCTHDRAWVVKTGQQMARYLALSYTPPEAAWKTVGELEIWRNELRDTGGAIALTDYAILWSKLTAAKKRTLCYDSGMKTASCDRPGDKRRRARINNLLKSNLMNDCFADAMIYVGPDGDNIRATVRRALGLISDDRRDNENPAAIISESLGSKIISDVVRTSPADDLRALQALARTRLIFMAANQIALLDLAERRDPGVLAPVDTLKALKDAILNFDRHTNALSLDSAIHSVAFSDPNDLLSYELARDDGTSASVRITIAPIWFGLFVDPWHAHTHYLENENVWRFIACGSAKDC